MRSQLKKEDEVNKLRMLEQKKIGLPLLEKAEIDYLREKSFSKVVGILLARLGIANMAQDDIKSVVELNGIELPRKIAIKRA